GERAEDHGLLVVELAVVGGDDNAVGEAGEHAPDLDLGGVEEGDPAVDGQPTAAEDQQVEVNLWRFLHGAGIDRAQFGGQEAAEHDHPTAALAYRDRGVQAVGDHREVAALGSLRGAGMGGRASVDSGAGAGFNESGDDAGDRGLLGCPGRGTGAVGGGAAGDRPAVYPLEVSRTRGPGGGAGGGAAG